MGILSRCLPPLEVGGGRPLLVRREKVEPRRTGQRILFASDLHLRGDGPREVVAEMIAIAVRESPNLVLLGGDLMDWKSGASSLEALVRELTRIAPVGAVSGNHDRWIGLAKVRAAVLAGGGFWLEDEPLRLEQGYVVYGSYAQPLLDASCHVLCIHHPAGSGLKSRFDLILSGHLHGGQLVLYQHRGRLYPGAFLYRWNGLRFDEKGKTLLVSRGVQDTLPLRWNCPREVLIVEM